MLAPLPSHALGPVDGELGLLYWNDSVSGSLFDGELDLGTGGLYGELWLANKWGVSGRYYRSDFEGTRFDSSKHFYLDAKRRFLSATDNTYFAIGFGFENFDLSSGGSSSGLRLVADGRLGLAGIVYFYGLAAWIPELESFADLDDIDAKELEFGLAADPLPFATLKLGYRQYDIDHNLGSTESDGLIFSAGFHW